MKTLTKVGAISAAVVGVVAIMLVGTTRGDVAASAATCMTETRNLAVCSAPDARAGGGFWGVVGLFALAGSMVGVGAFGAGRHARE